MKPTKFVRKVLASIVHRTVRANADVIYNEVEKVRKKRRAAGVEHLRSDLQSCGAQVSFRGQIFISDPKKVCIGSNVCVEDNAYFKTEGGLTIGGNTHISRNVSICTVHPNNLGREATGSDVKVHEPVLIGRNVYIGRNVNIAPGSRIGDGAVIGMGAVIAGEIPPFAVVGSQPVCILGHRTEAPVRQRKSERLHRPSGGEVPSKDEAEELCRGAEDTPIFFVVSTGRAGSMSIARLLSQHPEITCFHEPRRQWVRLSMEHAHGLKKEEKVRAELHAVYCNSSVYPEGLYGESDHHLFNLVSILGELIPTSKFIWLIRDGRDMVASATGRGWFDPERKWAARPTAKDDPGIWDYYRLEGDACGEFAPEEWQRFSVFERNCWYWDYANRLMEQQLNALPGDRWQMVRLEDLSEQRDDLLRFLGAEIRTVPMEWVNVASYDVRRHDEWTPEESEAFARFCGESMDRWYPEWQNTESVGS